MKTRTLVSILILALAVLVVTGSCATKKQAYIPKSKEELYGTWVNIDYHGFSRPQKFIHYDWGYTERFDLVTDNTVTTRGTFCIIDKWADSEGNTWYKVIWQYRGFPGVKNFFLVKINENESSWEEVWSYKDFPTESDLTTENTNYGIWYRQE